MFLALDQSSRILGVRKPNVKKNFGFWSNQWLDDLFHIWQISFMFKKRAHILQTQCKIQHVLLCSSYGLQEEQQAAKSKHEAEVFELRHQLGRLSSLAERGNQALQQKAQVRKAPLFFFCSVKFICDVSQSLNKAKDQDWLMGMVV